MWNATDWQNVVFSDESRFVLGTDDNCVRVWRRPGKRCNSSHTVLRHTARTAGVMTLLWPARSPDLSPVEHLWDQLKRQMPLRHSVHDLEWAVQDLLAHLPQDNIRCLINSMPDHVAKCIAGGEGIVSQACLFSQSIACQKRVWPMNAQRLVQDTPLATSQDQLSQYAEAAWIAVPQGYIQSKFDYMPMCMAANLGGRTGKILRPSSVALKSKNQEINRLQLAVKLPWAIFFESVDILS
ncbi:HTH_Tnp_Tc3_2 domain-containing protein [Trichonephila clavipes]|nr:HTH_Tnp_Tc3_2 domain-containing protein [Trichonephila clavipes]